MLQKKRFLPAIPLLALLAPILACENPYDLGDPSFIGVIRKIVDQDDRRLRFDVDIEKTITWSLPRSRGARVNVYSDTQLLVEQPDGSLVQGWRGDLSVGRTVRVWHEPQRFINSVQPPYAAALRIEILQPVTSVVCFQGNNWTKG